MDGLGDTKQLQLTQKRKAQAIDKMVNPPMVADVSMKNQPASGLPGGVTYVAGFGRDRPGFAPAYQVMPPIAELKQDINETQERIKRTFFNNCSPTFPTSRPCDRRRRLRRGGKKSC
jgi:hypothetical protein